MTIRPAVPADAAPVAALRMSVYPYLVRDERSTRHLITSPPPGVDWAGFVAERDGVVAGWVAAYRNPRSGLGQISLLHVHPSARRQGLGAALFAAAAGHLRSLGIERVAGTTTVEALEFARRFGFTPTRELRYSALDLATFSVPAPKLDGIRLVPMRDLDEQALYAADVAAATDEPGDVPGQPSPYPTWRYEIWDHPGMDRDSSTAALAGSEIVSFSLLDRDGDRAWSDMTATVPAWRGRGLARTVKTETLRRAAASGVRTAYTSNDESNLPMLAVNTRLGYRPVATQLACLAQL